MKKTTANPHFLQDAADYLVANGYTMEEGRIATDAVMFLKGDLAVAVYGDNADFLRINPKEERSRGQFTRVHAFTGIDGLEIFEWMLLFHVTSTVPLKQFIRQVKKESSGQIHPLFQEIFERHFRIGTNHDAVPLNY